MRGDYPAVMALPSLWISVDASTGSAATGLGVQIINRMSLRTVQLRDVPIGGGLPFFSGVNLYKDRLCVSQPLEPPTSKSRW